MIPLPFARAAAIFGAPLSVGHGDDREVALCEVERALEGATAEAEWRVRA